MSLEKKQYYLASESWGLKHYLGISTIAEFKNSVLIDTVFITGRLNYDTNQAITMSMGLNELMVIARSLDKFLAIVRTKKSYENSTYEKIVDPNKAGSTGFMKKLYFSYDETSKKYFINIVEMKPIKFIVSFGFNSSEISSISESLKVMFTSAKSSYYDLQRDLKEDKENKSLRNDQRNNIIEHFNNNKTIIFKDSATSLCYKINKSSDWNYKNNIFYNKLYINYFITIDEIIDFKKRNNL